MESKDVIKKVNELMTQRGYSKYKMSRETKINESSLRYTLNHGSNMNIEGLSKICDVLAIKMSDFFALVEQEDKVSGGAEKVKRMDDVDEVSATDFPIVVWEKLQMSEKEYIYKMMSELLILRLKSEKEYEDDGDE